MLSKPIAVGLLAAGCLTAAGGGAYLAVRQSAVQAPAPIAASTPEGVTETEELVAEPAWAEPAAVDEEPPSPPPPAVPPRGQPAFDRQARNVNPARPRPAERSRPAPRAETPAPAAPSPPARWTPEPPAQVQAVPEVWTEEAPRYPAEPPAPPAREFVEILIPSTTVIGLQVDTPLTTERARVEDRVQARVTRDVTADGRLAIPAGARVLGSVIQVERGGKVKERARLGVRFHTVVLADGTELALRTEPIYREGEAPGGDSARKIGGAAAGGAILGAIIGGGKGAAIGGAAGAAGGTAVVMAGDRHPATLPAGTVVTVRLTDPVTMEVERH